MAHLRRRKVMPTAAQPVASSVAGPGDPPTGRRSGTDADITVPIDVPAVVGFGFWAAASTAMVAAVSLATGITTPPRSGPNCHGGCVAYPYTDAAAFVPRDYLWMYPTLLMAVVFVVLSVCIHYWVPPGRRLFSATGVCLTVMAAGALVVDYAVQLTVMQAGLRTGETEDLSVLSQYNPHGMFIGLENVGYATLNLAFVFLGIALATRGSKLARATAWVFVAGGALTLLLLVVYAGIYGTGLDYRFEVMSLLVTWLVLITVGVLLSVTFARAGLTPDTRLTREKVSRGDTAD